MTISEDGVTCSTSDAADAAADVPPVLTLPILDEIDATVTVGVSGSSLSAVRAAAKLLDWAAATGLGAEEVGDAASTWLASRNDDLTECLQKLEMVDDACQGLLTGEARAMLDSAGCAVVGCPERNLFTRTGAVIYFGVNPATCNLFTAFRAKTAFHLYPAIGTNNFSVNPLTAISAENRVRRYQLSAKDALRFAVRTRAALRAEDRPVNEFRAALFTKIGHNSPIKFTC